jgi:hypothetical protein
MSGFATPVSGGIPMRFASLFPVLAAAALLATPASARTWSHNWNVGAHPALRVTTNDARVRIHRGAPGRVSATVEYTVQVWGLHYRVNDPVIEFGQVGDAITVDARSKGFSIFFGGMTNERFHVDVTIPATCDVKVRTGDGGVELGPIAGDIDLLTGDGHIAVHGASGVLRLGTGDGGIDADSLDGALDAHSSDGHIKAEGRFDRLDLRSGDGHVRARISRGSKLAGPWSVRTADGGVELLIPRDLRALLDVAAGDGHVRVELPVSGIESRARHELRGQLNGGTVPLRVRTGDGSVMLGLSE